MTSISVDTKRVRKILAEIEAKRFAIPKLQREFVWDGRKAAKLLDSIVRGLPVGMVIIWQVDRSNQLSIRQDYSLLPVFDHNHKQIWFVMDGQQRLSVFHHVREGDVQENAGGREVDFARVVLALDPDDSSSEELIRYRWPVEGEYVSLKDVLDSRFGQKLAYLGKLKLRRLARRRAAILDYRLPVMFIRAELDDVREAFLRVNTQGMKITAAERIFARAEELNLRTVLHEIRDPLRAEFGAVEPAPVLFAMVAINGGEEARGNALDSAVTRLERRATDDPRYRRSLARKWSFLKTAFHKAVDYVCREFHVLHRGILYSDYIISMLAIFFFENGRGPDGFQKEQIRRWFWATSVGSRYSGRNFNRFIRDDVRYFKKLGAGKRIRFPYTPEVDRSDLRRAPYASRSGIAAAVYALLVGRRPVSITDDGMNEIPEKYFAAANRKDRHHIFPAAAASAAGIPPRDFNSIVNICLLTAQENQEIGRTAPRNYLADVRERERIFRKKMARHLIPIDDASGVWARDLKGGFRRFIARRTDVLCEELEREAGMRLFRREERRA